MPDSVYRPACRNCGEPRSGRFCSRCGQEDMPDQAFGRMVREFLGDVFNLDAIAVVSVATLGLVLLRL